MNKKWIRVLLAVVVVLFAIGAVASVVMIVSAASFGELGRVLFYSVAALVCLEAVILAVVKLREKDKS